MDTFNQILDTILKAAGVLDVMFFLAYSIKELLDRISQWRDRHGKN